MSPSFVGTEPAIFNHYGVDYEAVIDMHLAGYAVFAADLIRLRGSFRGKQPCSEMLRVVAALGGLTHNMTDFVSLH